MLNDKDIKNPSSIEDKVPLGSKTEEEKIIDLDSVIAKESVKTPYRNDIFEKTLDLGNGSKIPYRFKPVDMDDYLEAQTDGTTDELFVNILSMSLLTPKDEFYTKQQVKKGIPKQWRIMIYAEILEESGITVDPEIMGF